VGAALVTESTSRREFNGDDDLVYFRQRFYDPSLGRFIQIDPEEPFHYAYANNSPLNFVDPTGRSPASEYAALLCNTVVPTLMFVKGVNATIIGLFGVSIQVLQAVNQNKPIGPIPPVPFPPIPGVPPTPFSVCGINYAPDHGPYMPHFSFDGGLSIGAGPGWN
jgi:RHS repeat-associated protein